MSFATGHAWRARLLRRPGSWTGTEAANSLDAGGWSGPPSPVEQASRRRSGRFCTGLAQLPQDVQEFLWAKANPDVAKF